MPLFALKFAVRPAWLLAVVGAATACASPGADAGSVAPTDSAAEVAAVDVAPADAPADAPAADQASGPDDAPAADQATGELADVTAVSDAVAPAQDVTAADGAPAGDSTAAADLAGEVTPPAAPPIVAPSPPKWSGGFTDITEQVPGKLQILLGQPWAAPGQVKPLPPWCTGTISDVTGDGQADLVHFCQGGVARVLSGFDKVPIEDGTIKPKPSNDYRAHAIAVIDRLGDGGRDVVIARTEPVSFRKVGGEWQDQSAALKLGPSLTTVRQGLHTADVDQDGLLDLMVCNFECSKDNSGEVLLNRGDGSFDDRTNLLGLSAGGSQWGGLAADMDQDGDPDVLWIQDGCANPKTTQYFYRNVGRGPKGWPKYQRQAPHDLFAFPVAPMPYASPMGAAVGDTDLDGKLELLIANVGLSLPISVMMKFLVTEDETLPRLAQNNLLRPQPDGTWKDVGLEVGLKSIVDPQKKLDLIAWSPLLFDFDRDGWLDIALAHAPDYDAYATNSRGPMRPVLLRNQGGGTFTEVSTAAGFPLMFEGMSLSAGDLDGDGDDDLLLGGLGQKPRLLRNDVQTPHHRLRVRLQGKTSNSLGIGAMVQVQVGDHLLRRAVGAASPFSTQHEPVADFGLGGATEAAVTVHWPSGYVQELGVVKADQTLTVAEPPLLVIGPRVLHFQDSVSVTARAFAPSGQPSGGSVQIELQPPDVLAWSKPLTCQPDGTCQGVLKPSQLPTQAITVFVKATLGGQLLKVWPRLTILPLGE